MGNELLIEGVKGVGRSSSILVVEGGVRLPDEDCRLVKLANWNAANDESFAFKAAPGLIEESGDEVYWGFAGIYAHQLFTSRETDWIPVNNLNQISLRSRPGETVHVWYSWIF